MSEMTTNQNAKTKENIISEVDNMSNENLTQEVTNENVQAEETQDVVIVNPMTLKEFKKKVTIKKTIGILEKQQVVQLIYNNCLEKDTVNNIFYINTLMKKSAFNLAILDTHTDFYASIENAKHYGYDYLNEIGVFDYVLENVDIVDIQEAIDNFSTIVADLNSVGACLHRTINELIAKLPNTKEVKKMLEKVSKIADKTGVNLKPNNIVDINKNK